MSENLPVHVPPVDVGSVPHTEVLDSAAVFDRNRRIRRMIKLARFLDSAITLPGTTYTFGFDPLLGLVPVLGDFVTTSISVFIIYDAIKIGATPNQILRMVFNVCLDFLIGEISVLGDIFDFAWKSNIRNLKVMGIDPADPPPPIDIT